MPEEKSDTHRERETHTERERERERFYDNTSRIEIRLIHLTDR